MPKLATAVAANPPVEGQRSPPRRIPEDLIRTAERMFATNGIGAPLRQIAAEAGYRNPATVQYHFGSRAGLIAAILEYRLPGLDRRRLQLLGQLHARGSDYDLRGLVEAMVRPFLELDRDAYYIEFLVLLGGQAELFAAYRSLTEHLKGAGEVQQRMLGKLEFLPSPIRENRLIMAKDLMLSAIATRRIALRSGKYEHLAPNDELFAQDLFDGMVGLLQAEHTELRVTAR